MASHSETGGDADCSRHAKLPLDEGYTNQYSLQTVHQEAQRGRSQVTFQNVTNENKPRDHVYPKTVRS